MQSFLGCFISHISQKYNLKIGSKMKLKIDDHLQNSLKKQKKKREDSRRASFRSIFSSPHTKRLLHSFYFRLECFSTKKVSEGFRKTITPSKNRMANLDFWCDDCFALNVSFFCHNFIPFAMTIIPFIW